MKNVVILGSTGSIGRNVLKVVKSLPGRFNVVGAAASSSVERLVEQASEFQIGTIALLDPAAAWRARNLAPAGVKVLEGVEGLCELASRPDVDLVVCAIVGMAALKPVLAAIDAGHDVAIATKEVLVSAGEVVCRRCAEKGVNLLPVEPQPYLEFNYLVRHARAVITDSGGITEETTVMGVPCLTLRDNTERPETVTVGTNELIGTDPAALAPAFARLFAGQWKKGGIPEKWDGRTGERIVAHLERLLVDGGPGRGW